MIDLHCHYLPGIDDGASHLGEALELARASVDNGIQCAVMTPHLHPGRWENFAGDIASHTRALREALDNAQIPLKICHAAEVRLSPEIPMLIEQGRVPFLGEVDGQKIMLLEFPHGHIPLGADKLVWRLLQMKVRPVIAHPERNKDVMRDPGKLAPFIEMGCILQLTAASVCGRFGERAQHAALEILQSESEKIIATDAHNLQSRPPLMREGMAAAAEVVGEEAATHMAQTLPWRIIRSQFESPSQPLPAGDDAPPEQKPAQNSPPPRATTLAQVRGALAAPPLSQRDHAPAHHDTLDKLLLQLVDDRLQRLLAHEGVSPATPGSEEIARRYHRELLRILSR